ncbi:Thioredoxin-like protein HCF164, chloroplastic [Linum grandiflorum]
MAHVATTSTIHTFRPHFLYTGKSRSQPPAKVIYRHLGKSGKSFPVIACETNSNASTDSSTVKVPPPFRSVKLQEKEAAEPSPSDSAAEGTSSSSDSPGFPEFPTRNLNRRIAVGSGVAGIGLFLFRRLDFGVSLKDLSAAALPYEEALSNGKPTVVEFYADWCEWEQELDEFGVEGIPHFAFLDRDGNEEGNVVGKLPRRYLQENVEALASGEATVPHARIVGQYSRAEARKVRPVVDPRSHGS